MLLARSALLPLANVNARAGGNACHLALNVCGRVDKSACHAGERDSLFVHVSATEMLGCSLGGPELLVSEGPGHMQQKATREANKNGNTCGNLISAGLSSAKELRGEKRRFQGVTSKRIFPRSITKRNLGCAPQREHLARKMSPEKF